MGRRTRAPIAFTILAALSVIAAFAMTATACAAATVTNQRPLLFSFDGSDTTAGKFPADCGLETACFFKGVGAVAVDDSTGDVYAADGTAEAVDKFNAEGQAEVFATGPAGGTSSLFGRSSTEPFKAQAQFFFDNSFLAVDNSGGLGGLGEGEQGRLYVGTSGPIDAFDRHGAFLWSISPQVAGQVLCGATVDAQGHLWASFRENAEPPHGKVVEFDTTGTATPSLTPIREIDITSGSKLPCTLAVARNSEALYVADKFDEGTTSRAGLDKYVNGTFDSIVSSAPTRGVTVDQSEAGGHVFSVQRPESGELKFQDSVLNEYEPCSSAGCGATLLSSSDPGLIGDGRGVAYNPAKDWVYVPDHLTQTVKVFGPRASGAAPTASEGETDEITKTEATAHGTVNPAGLPNSYHFELVRAERQKVVINATGGMFWFGTQTNNAIHRISERNLETETEPLPFDVSASELQSELEAILGAGNVEVSGTPAAGGVPGEFEILFKNELAGHFVSKLEGGFLYEIEEEEAGGIYKGGGHPYVEEHGRGQSIEVTRNPEGQLWAQSAQLRTRPEAYPSIEPTDSANHAVSLRFGGLRPNIPYDVRLVGTNTEPEGDPEKRLDDYSSAETFTTEPSQAPSLSGPTISAVSADSAHVAGTVDSQEDETVWRFLIATSVPFGAGQAECEALPQSAYSLIEEGTIPTGEASPVPVEADLTELGAAETACVRLVAINANPRPSVGDAVFTTEAVKPREAALAFVAPSTDTSARLNAYVNPEGGASLTYRFEYSPDGTNWTELPERVSTIDAHQQILVGEEINGLSPDTEYRYRLNLVRNEAGEISPTSLKEEEKSFTTRTTAELTIPPNALGEAEKRGLELVNKPDTGNQNARAAEIEDGTSPLRADGEEFLWTVLGGAPGANSGTQAAFLAKRTGSGWTSQSLVPPASDQVGGGDLSYFPFAASPDFERFVFEAAEPAVLGHGPPTYERLDTAGDQQVLTDDQRPLGRYLDATDDMRHILIVSPDTGKLEDVGSGVPEEVDLIPSGGSPMGVPQPGGSAPACGLNREGGSFIGFGAGGAGVQYEHGYHRMSSTDASRVYFQVHPDSTYPTCGGPWAIYERVRDAVPPTTTPVVPPGLATGDTEMIRVSPDGRSLYFVTSAKLASVDGNGHLDVYRWDEGTSTSTCLTCGVKNELGRTITDAHLATSSGDAGPVKVSDDFSHIYFNSPDRLVAGHGVEGGSNLYVLKGGKVYFVAASAPLNTGQPLSHDGNVLTFLSTARLTADPIAPRCPSLEKERAGALVPCQELYRYDARDGSIECLSCRHDGETANSVSLTGWGEAFQVSADGSTVAFVTAERLVPRDVNGSTDLYEWRDGAVRLITDGLTRYPVGYAAPIPQAIDADGSDIVFSVSDPGLTGYEQNGLANLYDARLGGGFPRPSPAEHCEGESCQGSLVAPPASSPPATSRFTGQGNPSVARSCSSTARRAHRLSRRVRTLRGRTDARAQGLAKAAHRLAQRARRCRHANGRTAK